MQTFVPYADFAESAKTLDMQRLGKQRLETLQIMKVLCGALTKKGNPYRGWSNHPAVNMWRGYEGALLKYQEAIVAEWVTRPRKSGKSSPDTCLKQTADTYFDWRERGFPDINGMPYWLGDEAVHESHRSNLIRKDSHYYLPQFADNTRLGLEYVWPTQATLEV